MKLSCALCAVLCCVCMRVYVYACVCVCVCLFDGSVCLSASIFACAHVLTFMLCMTVATAMLLVSNGLCHFLTQVCCCRGS